METDTEKLQNKVDNLKTLNLMQNLHKLSPLKQKMQDVSTDVAIVEALKSDPLIRSAVLQLKGYSLDPVSNKYTIFRNPVMNEAGIGNFMQVLSNIASTIEYGNFKEKQIPKMVVFLFNSNFPYFTLWHQEYELLKQDFNIISTLLFNFIISSFSKAKGAGHRNVVRGVYSEDVLAKAISGGEERKKKEGGFLNTLSKFNPMKRR